MLLAYSMKCSVASPAHLRHYLLRRRMSDYQGYPSVCQNTPPLGTILHQNWEVSAMSALAIVAVM